MTQEEYREVVIMMTHRNGMNVHSGLKASWSSSNYLQCIANIEACVKDCRIKQYFGVIKSYVDCPSLCTSINGGPCRKP